ncbi:MAG: hypothetical protein A3H97_11965 [Acidobacteria bacterium RIFCSPLOWO2_02_FULL_65_29]|nr:MAG: hypothetical protein A3H97_11965 [Acidobacteria bacterium RIFCSPLOWO2_02_FULL_65_29]
MGEISLLALLHLCDSLFPTGGFAHSDGLEVATADGTVASADALQQWMDVLLDDSLGRSEALAVVLAWRACIDDRTVDLEALDSLERLDREVYALRPSSTARAASRAMGARLLKTWWAIHPELVTKSPPGLRPAGGSSGPGAAAVRVTLPVAFGGVCASAGIDARAAAGGYIYTRLAATVSSAMRLMPIGQTEAHALLARTLARVPATLDAIEERVARGDRPGAFAPAFDIATMAQQHLRSRLFLT